MVSIEASWWNILNLKIYITLGYIVSLILLNLGQVFRYRNTLNSIYPIPSENSNNKFYKLNYVKGISNKIINIQYH